LAGILFKKKSKKDCRYTTLNLFNVQATERISCKMKTQVLFLLVALGSIAFTYGLEQASKEVKDELNAVEAKENVQAANDPIFGWLAHIFGDEETKRELACKECISVTPIHKYNNSIKQVVQTHQGGYVFAADFKGHQINKLGVKKFEFEVSDVYAHPDQNESKIKPGQKVVIQLNLKKCSCPLENLDKGVYLMTGDYKGENVNIDSNLVQLLHA